MSDFSIVIHHWLELIALYAVRPMVMIGVMPATDDPMLTVTARFQLCLVFATFCALGASTEDMQVLNLQSIIILLLREAMIGLAMGLTAGKMFWVAQALGAYVDNLVGYNNVQLMNPSSSEQSTPLADFFIQLCTALFYAMGGLLLLFELLVQSCKLWPVLGSEGPTWPHWHEKNISEGMSTFMSSIASVVSPLLFLFTIVDIVLGLLSRSAKGIDTTAIATPVKVVIALSSLSLFSSIFMDDIKSGLTMNGLLTQLKIWSSMS